MYELRLYCNDFADDRLFVDPLNNPAQNPAVQQRLRPQVADDRFFVDPLNNPVQNPAVQQRLRPQEANGIAEGSGSSILGLNHPIIESAPRNRTTNFTRTTEGREFC